MKYLQILIFVFIACMVVTNAGPGRAKTYQWGLMKVGDGLLSKETVSKPPSKLFSANQDYTYPPSNAAKKPHQVNEVRVTYLDTTGSAKFKGWGPGGKSATVNLNAPRGEGFKFLVEMYGN